MKSGLLAAVLCMAVLSFIGCKLPLNPGNKEEGALPGIGGETQGEEDESVLGYAERLFAENKEGIVEFRSRNKKYYTLKGYSLWKFSKEAECSNISIGVKKLKGDIRAGYGLVCFRKESGTGDTKTDEMLAVLINGTGEYAVGLVINGNYKQILWWKAHSALQKGYGLTNKIQVRAEGTLIYIYFNGVQAEVLEEVFKDKRKEGQWGYAAVISPHDRLPKDAVEIDYKKERT